MKIAMMRSIGVVNMKIAMTIDENIGIATRTVKPNLGKKRRETTIIQMMRKATKMISVERGASVTDVERLCLIVATRRIKEVAGTAAIVVAANHHEMQNVVDPRIGEIAEKRVTRVFSDQFCVK